MFTIAFIVRTITPFVHTATVGQQYVSIHPCTQGLGVLCISQSSEEATKCYYHLPVDKGEDAKAKWLTTPFLL